MSTYREICYLILDELKLTSDDSYYTEDHILYLMDKYRAFLLKQKYADIKKQIPESNYQTIVLTLENTPPIPVGGNIKDKNSTVSIPTPLKITLPRVFLSDEAYDYYNGEVAYISRDRMKYLSDSSFVGKIVYASLGINNKLYIKTKDHITSNTHATIVAVFEDSRAATKIGLTDTESVMDSNFPLEDALVNPLVELIVKELGVAEYKPEDNINNANDDLNKVAMAANQQQKK